MRKITNELIGEFKIHLIEEEKSKATVEKYLHDVIALFIWIDERKIDKGLILTQNGTYTVQG